MNFEVRVGDNNVLGFWFEKMDDVIQFVEYCLSNRYRVTVIPKGEIDEV